MWDALIRTFPMNKFHYRKFTLSETRDAYRHAQRIGIRVMRRHIGNGVYRLMRIA